MSGVNSSDFLYPEDPTGQAASNKVVNEFHTLTPPSDPLNYHFIIPDAAPYFLDSLKLFDVQSGRELVRGIDWTPGQKFDSASHELNNVRGGVYGSILFFNTAQSGQVELREYQTLGGGWTLSENKILDILSNREQDPRTLTYEEVSGKPAVYPPVDHSHDANDDLIGLSEVVTAQFAIAAAIREKISDPASDLGDYSNEDIDQMVDDLQSQIDQLDQDKLDKNATAKDAERAFGMSKDQLIIQIAQEVGNTSQTVIEVDSDTVCEFESVYFIKEYCTLTLPSTQSVTENQRIEFHKSIGVNAMIVTDPTTSAPIVIAEMEDNSLLYDVNRPIILMYDHSEGKWVI